MMHSLNVRKQDCQAAEELLDQYSIQYDVYDVPEDYSVYSFEGRIPASLVREARDLAVKGIWDESQIEEDDEGIGKWFHGSPA